MQKSINNQREIFDNLYKSLENLLVYFPNIYKMDDNSKNPKEKINANSTNKNLIRTPTQKYIYVAHPQQRLSYHLEQSVCI